MPRPCSLDLRMRVLREVQAGASRREAAECVEVSASSAIKWMQRLNETGSIAAKPSGGSISPLEAHAAVLLGLIAEQADLTLDRIVAVMRKRRIAGSRSAVWRFFKRHNVSFKKSLRAAEQQRADVVRARRRWMREQGMLPPSREQCCYNLRGVHKVPGYSIYQRAHKPQGIEIAREISRACMLL